MFYAWNARQGTELYKQTISKTQNRYTPLVTDRHYFDTAHHFSDTFHHLYDKNMRGCIKFCHFGTPFAYFVLYFRFFLHKHTWITYVRNINPRDIHPLLRIRARGGVRCKKNWHDICGWSSISLYVNGDVYKNFFGIFHHRNYFGRMSSGRFAAQNT